jgi:hydrogenase maturation protease
VLIVACGNTLRGDDGVGPEVGELLATRLAGTGASVIVSHQLLPELADDASRAQLVIFVDAAADHPVGTVSLRAVPPRRVPASTAVDAPAPAHPAGELGAPAHARGEFASPEVDASAHGAAVVLTPAPRSLDPFSHGMGPEDLLALTRDLYAATPEAVLVSVGAESFEAGAEVSPAVRLAIPKAVEAVLDAIAERTRRAAAPDA